MKYACALFLTALTGCTTTVDLAKIRLGEADVLRLEMEHWKASGNQWSPQQPIAVRELRCKREYSFKDMYWCDYALDYGSNGAVAGTLHKRDMLLGREKGQWQFQIIIS